MLIPAYFAFADIGMGMASTKFAAEAYALRDGAREGKVVRTAALIALLGTGTVAFPVVVLAPYILAWLNVPGEWLAGATVAIRIVAIANILVAVASVLNSPMLARLRVDLNAVTAAIPRCLYSAGGPIVLLLGFGIEGAATWFLIVSILGTVVVIAISGRLLPELVGLKIDRSLFAPLLRFGRGWLLAVMAVILLVNVEKLLLARMASVQTLAYYSIAFMVANTAMFLPQAMTQALLPAFSRLQSSVDGEAALQTLFRRCIRLNLFIEIPALTLMAVIARPLFRIWAGPEFEANSTVPLYILLAGLLFNMIAAIPHSLILSTGRTELLARLYWLQLLIYPLAAAVLIYYAGITGAAVAWSLRVIIDSFLIHVIARRASTARTEYRRLIVSPGLPALLLIPAIAAAFYDNYSLWLLMIVPVSVLGYCWAVWSTGLDGNERGWISNVLSRSVGSGHRS